MIAVKITVGLSIKTEYQIHKSSLYSRWRFFVSKKEVLRLEVKIMYFAKEIEKCIGVQTDTTAIDKELANYESKLKEVDLNKVCLERD